MLEELYLVYNLNIRNNLDSLFDFIRLKLCIFSSFLGMVGYLLFSPLSLNLVFISLVSFFVCAGAYAYNNITDREEDLINRKRVVPFSLSKSLLIVASCFILSIFFSLFLSSFSIFFCTILITISVFYSFFRIKRHLLIKNFYTGFGASLLVLLGAITFSNEAFWYYFLISIFFFTGSLISDLRDYEGDESVGIKTLPVCFGYDLTMKIVYFLLIGFSILVLGFNQYNLFPMLLFVPIMVFFLIKNKPSVSHFLGGVSLIFLVAWLMIV